MHEMLPHATQILKQLACQANGSTGAQQQQKKKKKEEEEEKKKHNRYLSSGATNECLYSLSQSAEGDVGDDLFSSVFICAGRR